QRAPIALPAVEMVLIRLAYAADLPSPADIVARLGDGAGTPAAAPASNSATASNGGSTALSSAPPTGASMAASSSATPQATMAAVAPEFEPAPEMVNAAAPDPATFRDLIALFAEKREIQIRNHLYMNVHLIAYEPGRLEFRPNDSAPGNLAGEVLNYLRDWRGAHWSVSVSGEVGDPTLAEQDSTHEQAERTAAAQDPVVRAALEIFAGSRIERVVSREGADVALAGDDGGYVDPDDDLDGEDSDS
ncbi:MAG: hypothetical protein O3C09_04295, partial [Proteobacteria bacterium]|nr:hypothetical protein [Pseudomonadota bacterium]